MESDHSGPACPQEEEEGGDIPSTPDSSCFQCRSYSYSDGLRSTSQEMIGIEKVICDSQFPSGGDKPRHIGLHKEAPGSARRERNEGKAWASACIVFPAGKNG